MAVQYRSTLTLLFLTLLFAASSCWAQQQAPENGNLPFGQNQGPFQGLNKPNFQQFGQGNTNQSGNQGGNQQADFDSLIDLIQSTVAFDSWAENGTGEGGIEPFVNGVYVDAAGTLKFFRSAIGKGLSRKNSRLPGPSI